MTRIRRSLALAGVLALALAGVAVAATSKVKGGTAQVTVSQAAASVLSANSITVKALAPATSSGNTFTFPISGGRLNTSNNHGTIVTKGGVTLSNGKADATIRRLTIVSNKHGVFVDGLVRGKTTHRCHTTGHHHTTCTTTVHWNTVRVATVKNVTVNGSSASGTVLLSAASAKVIDKLAGKDVAKAGDELGTATVSPTF